MQHSTCFMEKLSDELRAEAAQLLGLEERLGELYAQGTQAWPTLKLDSELFTQALAERTVSSPPKRGLEQWLNHVQAEDFHLALACGAGLPGAISLFEQRFLVDIERLVRKYQGDEMPAEDLLQHLRLKLFVSTDSRRAKIQSYSGQGFLQNWLRVTGARAFIDLLRSASRRQDKELFVRGGEQILDVPDELQGLELNFLKQEYQGQFKQAFAVAVQSLSPHERNLLRQHLVHRLTVGQLGRIYGTHASTASRRIAKARETLLTTTRREFMDRLKLERMEFDSIMLMIRSKLDLSIPRLLQTTMQVGKEEES